MYQDIKKSVQILDQVIAVCPLFDFNEKYLDYSSLRIICFFIKYISRIFEFIIQIHNISSKIDTNADSGYSSLRIIFFYENIFLEYLNFIFKYIIFLQKSIQMMIQVIAVCALFATHAIVLNWYSVCRYHHQIYWRTFEK